MRSTREKILRTLLSYPGSTINDLAEEVGINGISIRHHLSSLEAEALVVSAEERHGVGRPRLIYSLTDKGVEKFPTNYLRLTKQLINTLRERMTEEEINGLFEDIGSEIAEKHQDDFFDIPLEQKLINLKSLLHEEGFIIEYKKRHGSFIITSLSCPYYQIGLENPEICHLDYKLISDLLSTPLEIETCILKGDDRCTYHIQITEKEG